MNALQAFMPHAGLDYTRRRNYATSRSDREAVSRLSPWVRLRVIPEWELVAEVLKHHSVGEASKFIDEVCWRTYWKGWLKRRPTVWDAYLAELSEERRNMTDNRLYHSLVTAQSGIECMDTWTRELIETGYLHNHARMWYASIWIHTLQLPWTLGADFFFRHLFDGDAASNTLSWRWVAGLHTAGKAYLATADNIKQFTEGRFEPQISLATVPADVSSSSPNPPANPYEQLVPLNDFHRVGILLHEDDLSALNWLGDQAHVSAAAGFIPKQCYHEHGVASPVYDFRYQCMLESLDTQGSVYTDLSELVEWAQRANLDVLLMAEPSIGIWNQVLPELEETLLSHGIQLVLKHHWWDDHFYPHAQAGFFRFKKSIPAAIKQLIR